MPRFGRYFGCILVFISLSACQLKPTAPMGGLNDHQFWRLKARVSIKTPEDNVAATLDWQKAGKTFDFHLYGTFGVTYAQLIQKDDQAVLKLPDDQVYYHQEAKALLAQSFGWDFPIDALASWVKGLPSYETGETIKRDESGKLSKVTLNQWVVTFKRHQHYAGYLMPKIVEAKHPQLRLKVVVRDWEFLPEQTSLF